MIGLKDNARIVDISKWVSLQNSDEPQNLLFRGNIYPATEGNQIITTLDKNSGNKGKAS